MVKLGRPTRAQLRDMTRRRELRAEAVLGGLAAMAPPSGRTITLASGRVVVVRIIQPVDLARAMRMDLAGLTRQLQDLAQVTEVEPYLPLLETFARLVLVRPRLVARPEDVTDPVAQVWLGDLLVEEQLELAEAAMGQR